jgi:hypothetical protein
VAGELIIAGYIIGCFATAYIMGRLDCDDYLMLVPVLLWPPFAVFGGPMLLAQFLYDLGQRHR